MKIVTIGKRLVSSDQIALVEAFDPASNPEFKPEKNFKSRLLLLDRDAVLTEQTPKEFADEHELHMLAEDNVGINRKISFRVETFEPNEKFTPSKPFKTRLKWRDFMGNEQSKLLLTAPEIVIAEILGHEVPKPEAAVRQSKRPARGRRGSRRMEAFES